MSDPNYLLRDEPAGVAAADALMGVLGYRRVHDFRERYDSLIRARFSYEEKLKLMRWFPVTSLMSVDQLSRYLEAVRDDYARSGVFLDFPDDKWRAA